MKTWLKLLLTFVVMPIAVTGFFYVLDKKGFFNLNNIEIVIEKSSGTRRAIRNSVERVDQQFQALKGQSLWSLKLKQISASLQQEDWIESFQMTRQWPATLHVSIRPRELFFITLSPKGEIRPVMENGAYLDVLQAGEAPDLPIAIGKEFEKSQDVRVRAISILKQIPERGSFSRHTISEVHFDQKNGFSFVMVENGLRVKIGEEKVRTKSFRVSQVIDYLENKKFQARVIDANLSQKVLVRLRKDP